VDAHREAFFVNFAQIRPPQAHLALSAELIGAHSDFIKFHLTFKYLITSNRLTFLLNYHAFQYKSSHCKFGCDEVAACGNHTNDAKIMSTSKVVLDYISN